MCTRGLCTTFRTSSCASIIDDEVAADVECRRWKDGCCPKVDHISLDEFHNPNTLFIYVLFRFVMDHRSEDNGHERHGHQRQSSLPSTASAAVDSSSPTIDDPSPQLHPDIAGFGGYDVAPASSMNPAASAIHESAAHKGPKRSRLGENEKDSGKFEISIDLGSFWCFRRDLHWTSYFAFSSPSPLRVCHWQ